MTRFNELLKDDEVAAVLTYVRNSWGNKGAPVKAETVKTLRKQHEKRFLPWNAEALLKEHPLKK